MILDLDNQSVLVFDLDDTLYREYDFVVSGFKTISNLFIGKEEEVFSEMLKTFNDNGDTLEKLINKYSCGMITKDDLLNLYRYHTPSIKLPYHSRKFLFKIKKLGCITGLLSDGRSITQRNKLLALGLESYFDLVVISEEIGSEKPALRNYQIFIETFGNKHFVLFGDNPAKDFLTPNSLGWLTIGILDQGQNISKQDCTLNEQFHPNYWIRNFSEICLNKFPRINI